MVSSISCVRASPLHRLDFFSRLPAPERDRCSPPSRLVHRRLPLPLPTAAGDPSQASTHGARDSRQGLLPRRDGPASLRRRLRQLSRRAGLRSFTLRLHPAAVQGHLPGGHELTQAGLLGLGAPRHRQPYGVRLLPLQRRRAGSISQGG